MSERLTLVVTVENRRSRLSEQARVPALQHVLFVDSPARMHATLGALDVERIILDRSVSAEEFLFLLAELPAEVTGDVMAVRDDGGAFLSATGRGGDRVLYALAPHDVAFYLETHGLVFNRERLALIA